jgi:cytochrome c-type biogenesis protein CcmH/NrfG
MRLAGIAAITAVLLGTTGCYSDNHYVARGDKFFSERKYEDATLAYRKAIQKNPGFGEAYLKLGSAELQRGNVQPAESALQRAIVLMPDRMEPVAELADLYMTSYLADPGKPAALYEKISKLVFQLLQKDPNSFSGLRISGYLAMSDNHPKEAIDKFTRANQIRPDQADVLTMLVENLFVDGQADAGESLAERFLEKHANYGPLYDILYAHFKDAKRPDQAEKILKLKVANNPRESFFVIQLCRHYWNSGKREQAEGLLGELAAHPDRFTNPYLDAGGFYAEVQDLNGATRAYEAGMRAKPKEKLVYQKHLARTLLAAGKRSEAETLLGEILKDHPDDEAARASLAALHLANGTPGDLTKAISELKSLIAQKPDNIDYRYQLGRAYEMTGDENSAKDEYLAAIRLRGDQGPSLLALAHMFLREERFGDAQRYADAVPDVDGSEPPLDR